MSLVRIMVVIGITHQLAIARHVSRPDLKGRRAFCEFTLMPGKGTFHNTGRDGRHPRSRLAQACFTLCQRTNRDWFLRFAHLASFAYDAPKKYAVDTIRALGQQWIQAVTGGVCKSTATSLLSVQLKMIY
eukprot:4937748-Amphidinium_carterae.2